ncbi:MAG: hypothetical protein ACOC8K_08035 [Gemmatimonadota bacterium]
MSSDDQDIWYRLGYALERLRDAPRSLPALETLKSGGGASKKARGSGNPDGSPSDAPRNDDSGNLPARLIDQGARALGARLLSVLPSRGRARLLDLLASAAAGTAATVIAEVLASLTPSERDLPLNTDELAVALSGGAGRGLAYAGVIEPRIPGPAFVAGIVYGTAEYVTASWGGIPALLGSASPHRKVPLLSEIVEVDEREADPFFQHLVFGLALALLYDALRPKRGTTEEE